MGKVWDFTYRAIRANRVPLRLAFRTSAMRSSPTDIGVHVLGGAYVLSLNNPGARVCLYVHRDRRVTALYHAADF